jgi:hypothetical protein
MDVFRNVIVRSYPHAAGRRDGKGRELDPFHVLSRIGVDADLFTDLNK